MSKLPASRTEWNELVNASAAEPLLRRDAGAFIRQQGSTPCFSAIRKAEGIWIEDMDGHRYMDFHGNSVHHIGYGHPRLKAALKAQIDDLPFTPRRYTSEPAVALAERLIASSPHKDGRVLFATGGSDAIEIALKLAKVKTGRYKTLAFWDSYHGHGFGAVSAAGNGTDRTHRIGPLLPGGLLVPPFNCGDCAYGFKADSAGNPPLETCGMMCARMLRYTLEQEQGDIAAVIAEPIRSTPHVPPTGFWQEVRKACDDFGAVLIFDEIPTGLGKTGKLFSSEHQGVKPDITVLGKSLGGGMLPLAAVIADPAFDIAPELSLGHYTHEKNPMTTRAGLTTLEIIEDEGLVERSRDLGARTRDRLAEMAQRLPMFGHTEGAGLLIGLHLVEGEDRRPATQLAQRAMWHALALGLSLKNKGGSLVLNPPLVISDTEMDQALDIVEQAVVAAAEAN